MAYSVVETEISNPARKNPGQIINLLLGNPARKKGKSMAKHLSAKQIKYFGSKAQKAALKRKRSNAGKKRFHKARSKPRSNPAKKKFRAKRRTIPAVRDVNFLLGNAGRRKGSKKNVAKSRKKSFRKAASHSHRNAGRKKTFRSRGRRNPAGLGRPMDWVKGGAGVLAGVLVTRAVPQMLFSGSNTGATGYAMNAGTAIVAAWATHAVTKDPVLTASVAAGGFASVIARIITDMTPFGSYVSSLSGVGDYQMSNIVGTVPQRIMWPSANMQVGWGAPAIAGAAPQTSSSMDVGRSSGNV